MAALALERLVNWMSAYAFVDRNRRLPVGLILQYHSRSDEHSKKLGEFIVDDLLDACPALRDQAARGLVAFGINYRYRWPNGKVKTLDLAIGVPAVAQGPPSAGRIRQFNSREPSDAFSRVLFACEEKAVMTEHSKSQPRIYSELNDAHTIVHQGDRDTIAAGITMVNIAKTFISPLRQRPELPIEVTAHRQPQVTANMVNHLRALPLRDETNRVGLDAYCTFVVDLDNQGTVSLHIAAPAPQVGDSDNYETFLTRVSHCYKERFEDPAALSGRAMGLSVEESLRQLAGNHPGLLSRAGALVASDPDGGRELEAILIELDVPPAGPST